MFARHLIKTSASIPEPGSSFSISQFNVLADHLSDAFPLVQPEYLSWEYRSTRLLEEITRFPADFITLQLALHGYQGIFLRKSHGIDGCALFYRADRFTLQSHEDIIFGQMLELEGASQVALIALFRHLESHRQIIIANTHLKAKDFEDVRVKEIQALLTRSDQFVRAQSAEKVPIVIGGDFNSEPTGPVYGFVKAFSNAHWPLLSSAYAAYCEKGEPEFTTWKIRPPLESCRVIDYIFYDATRLDVTHLLSIPDKDQVPGERLPAAEYPSDHLMIQAHFYWV